jgi:light-regulated signal transduction histidine kinase (bacteriophytochrome)
MGLLVDELLNLAKVGRQSLNLQLVDLAPIAERVIAEFASSHEGRKVEWKLGELPWAHCDANLMKQVFQHLISNAIKYTRLRQRAVIEIGKTEAGGQTSIFVRDNGVGFNMKYVGKLFGVFQRLHRNEDFEGTGVGLATVQRIVQKHSGQVWAEGEIDHGATFYFTLKGLEQKPGAQESK